MRKVMYKLNDLEDLKIGFFHCWSGTMQDAYALIEDTTTGHMHCVNAALFRFVQPPETRQHSKDAPGWVEPLLNVLKSIEKKLSSL